MDDYYDIDDDFSDTSDCNVVAEASADDEPPIDGIPLPETNGDADDDPEYRPTVEGEEDDAETYVPQSLADMEDGDATYIPRATAEEEDEREELCDDEKTIALDELSQVASICLTHPRQIFTIEGLLRRQASRRIGWQEDRKTRRLFGRWLGEFVERIVRTRSPVELFDLLAVSIRPCSAPLVELWRAELDNLRNEDGSCDEWREFDE